MKIAQFFHRVLKGSNAQRYANAWWKWESAVSFLVQRPDDSTPKEALAIATLENHYFVNRAWLTPRQLLRGLKELKKIPVTIVHGQYDMVCPISAVYEFKKALPHTNVIITLAGHAAAEKETTIALKQATKIAYKNRGTRKHTKN
jgi:proline iminopeptidase